MIHIISGTKAQLIKMAVVMLELQKRSVDYNFIDTGQHLKTTEHLLKQFGIKKPDYRFIEERENIVSNFQGIRWIFKVLFKAFRDRKKIFKGDKGGICLIHGDTTSTLLAAIICKLSGIRIVHVEAGYRSPTLFKPFPEEMIRRFVDRISDFLVSSRPYCEENMKKEKLKGKIWDVGENTLIDIVNIAKEKCDDYDFPEGAILVSMHRYETIHSKSRMQFTVDLLQRLSKDYKIVWGLHEPTEKALKRFGLYEQLDKNENVQLRGLFDYFEFISAISQCVFMMTDGGGPKDETKYLGTPCLFMCTENDTPPTPQILQADFDIEKIDKFLENIESYRSEPEGDQVSPSKRIVDFVLREEKI